MLQAVLFDMDGVLFDSERAVLGVWRGIAEEWALPGIDGVFLSCVGTNKARTREILAEAYPTLDFERFDETVRARFLSCFGNGRLPVKPGAAEILSALKRAGVPLALASSTRRATVERELAEADLLRWFDVVVGGDSVRHSKPDPEIFLTAAALLGKEPSACWVVEDSFNGVRAARAGGFHALMVPDLLPPDAEMREKAEVIAADLDEAQRFLLGQLEATV